MSQQDGITGWDNRVMRYIDRMGVEDERQTQDGDMRIMLQCQQDGDMEMRWG